MPSCIYCINIVNEFELAYFLREETFTLSKLPKWTDKYLIRKYYHILNNQEVFIPFLTIVNFLIF